MLISTLGTLAGYAAVYFAFFAKPVAQPQQQEPQGTTTEVVVLDHVVEVTETDSLLEPRQTAPAGVPFDAPERTEFTTPTSVPTAPIPRSVD
jgi:hypothetical protein